MIRRFVVLAALLAAWLPPARTARTTSCVEPVVSDEPFSKVVIAWPDALSSTRSCPMESSSEVAMRISTFAWFTSMLGGKPVVLTGVGGSVSRTTMIAHWRSVKFTEPTLGRRSAQRRRGHDPRAAPTRTRLPLRPTTAYHGVGRRRLHDHGPGP